MQAAGRVRNPQFKPSQRVRHKREFDLVYRQSRRFSDGMFTVLVRANTLGRPRLGLSIPARAVGNSVSRNRIKRVVRESFRLNQHSLPAYDLVVNARNAARNALNRQLSDSLQRQWRNVIAACANP